MKNIMVIKMFIIFSLLVSLCFAVEDDNQEIARKKKYHKYHLLYGGGIAYYLIFIAIKIKLIFIVGTTIAAAVFVGKIFAFLKYITLWLEEKKHIYSDHGHGHDEKIVIHADPHVSAAPWSSGSWPSGPGDEYFHRKNDYKPYPVRYSTIKGDGSNSASYARKIGDTISDNIDTIKSLMYNMDLTDYTFDEMNIKDNQCRKRFMCEADFRARDNSLLALGLYIFSDHGLDKYRSEEIKITSLADCLRIYRDCIKFEGT